MESEALYGYKVGPGKPVKGEITLVAISVLFKRPFLGVLSLNSIYNYSRGPPRRVHLPDSVRAGGTFLKKAHYPCETWKKLSFSGWKL